MFPAGTYVYSGSLRVERDGLRLVGSPGAVLLNSSTKAIEPIILIGNNTSIDGLTIRSSRRSRHTDSNYIIRVAGQSQSVINTTVEYGGILIEGATNCLIASNSVTNSPADSIRNTDARNCQVLGNTVRLAGDDMVSVVSTQGESPLNSNILIEGNNLAHQFWGRGIAVVGGENITIRNNFISDTYAAAGIIIAQENNYNTYGVRNVLIEGNQISNVQTTGQPKDGIRVGHGAIVMNANSSPVVGVLIRGNTISGTMTDGIDVRSKSCGIAILSNVMVDIGRNPIRLSDGVSSGSCVVVCRDNIFENEPVTHERCGGLEPVVTGYSP